MTRKSTHTHTHSHIHIHSHTHTYTLSHTHIHTYTHTHKHTYTHSHTHTQTHTLTLTPPSLCVCGSSQACVSGSALQTPHGEPQCRPSEEEHHAALCLLSEELLGLPHSHQEVRATSVSSCCRFSPLLVRKHRGKTITTL